MAELDERTRALIASASRYVVQGAPEGEDEFEGPVPAEDVPAHPTYEEPPAEHRYGGKTARELIRSLPPGSKVETKEPLRPHPAPVRTSDTPPDIDPPAAVASLAEKVRAQGWSVNLTYARGHGRHATTGRPTKVVDSWAVRAWSGARRAVAVWTDGTWGSMWGVAHMFHARTQEQWLMYLNECEFGDVDSWLVEARAENARLARIKPCANAEIHPEHKWISAGEKKTCRGRTTALTKKIKESGG